VPFASPQPQIAHPNGAHAAIVTHNTESVGIAVGTVGKQQPPVTSKAGGDVDRVTVCYLKTSRTDVAIHSGQHPRCGGVAALT
jgi:hypothetical protein